MNKKGILSAVILGALTTSLYAATQGALVHGDTTNIESTGDLDVSLQVPYAIQVNNLNDIDFGDFQAGISTGVNKGDRFCVFTNAQSFNVTFHSSNPSGNTPRLTSISNPALTIPYQLHLGKIDMTKTRYILDPIIQGQAITNITETRNRLNCQMDGPNGVGFYPNLVIRARIAEGVLLDAIPDSYKDTLTVVASPE
jgi:spore coat protein U-like protein